MTDEDQIEVTPEMVKAGVDAYLNIPADMGSIEDRVESIFVAMILVKEAASKR